METEAGAGTLRSYIYSIVAILIITGLAGSEFDAPANGLFSARGEVPDADVPSLQAEPFAVILPNGERAEGWIAVPLDGAPHALVVLCHAYAGSAEELQGDLVELAEHGAVAVAMQYRGPVDAFNVKNGAEDTAAATEFLLGTYPTIETTIIYGFSMGGAVAGVTVASMPPGTFDHWIAGAPVADLTSFWQHSEGFRPILEAETGGRPGETRTAYAARSPLALVEEIAQANLTSVVVVHARADPIVPFADARELYEDLDEQGVRATFFAVGGNEIPWACSRLERICVANPWVTLDSHMVGHLPTISPLLFGLLDGTWTPTPGFHEVHVKGDERVPRLLP